MVKMMVKEEVGKIEAPITEESCNEEKVKAIITEEISKIQKPDNKGDSDSTNNEVDKAANPITRKETVTNVLEEINERRSRENNLIVFGIPEIDDESKEVRDNTDKEKLNELFTDCKIKLDKENLKTVKRLGKFNKEKLNRPILVKLPIDQLLLSLIYRTPSNRSQEYIKQLNTLTTEACSKGYSHILIMGDYNFPEINWDSWNSPGESTESNEYKFLENLQENFLFQHVTRPTRWRGTNTPHTLDLILTNEENMISNLEYQSPLGKSDHCTMKFDFSCYTNIKSKPKIIKLFSIGNYIKIKEELDNIKMVRITTERK
ncbi:unnamed protein product [Mytilus coruscus]|uniref:Endonuclease/exonuclease/phosphatase domain-containing protein n=1 Tax=Mytilus coruscus TaxID=42192 RepID=A0A6J8D2D4_MYTCO|nr:unnamed protein product [Mytilus coruscus]